MTPTITTEYLIAQGIGLIGTVLFFLSFQFKENKKLFFIQFMSYVFYTTHFLLLGAFTGGLSYMINTIRSLCLATENKFLKSNAMCWILCGLQLLTLMITWVGWISLLPVVANIATTIGGYTKNPRKIRIAGMFINSPLWIIYNIIVGSWAGILDEIVTESSMIISIIRFGWKNLDEVQ